MPELPDVEVYVACLAPRIVGRRIERIRLLRPFVLRSVAPPLDDAAGRTVESVARLGKRIVIGLAGGLFLVLHLMIAGRLRWRERGAAIPKKLGLAAFDFSSGTLLMTEAGSIKRAALHVAAGQAGLQAHDRGGLEPLAADADAFRDALTRENHTLKRSLTDSRLFSGIGNAYSDEILHAAGLSPLTLTQRLTSAEITRLREAARKTLIDWTARLRRAAGDDFPEKVTAFRPGMAVHGRYGKPCPACDGPVQRIVYAGNESNYCPACQTGGKLLADRALSRLLKRDWPRTLEEMEALHDERRASAKPQS
ncbi:MAG: formamidopyrimidine-DNA glycosylase [Acidobacteria bacterium]|nr:formamidopyrimidine-DNA glycosylase [Acidobacteriota bacterium]